MTVHKDRVQLLVQALESGDYQQTSAKLCKVDSAGSKTYCCLGIACEIAIANGLNIAVTHQEGNRADYGHLKYDHESAYLPDNVREWYGFNEIDPTVAVALDPDTDPVMVKATSANDKYRLPFTEIAAGFRRTYLTDEEVPGGES